MLATGIVDTSETTRHLWRGLLPTRETTAPSRHYAHHAFDTARFNVLAERWLRETAALSSLEDITEHQDYQEIIKLGWPAVPLVLQRLADEPRYWFTALYELTGDNPVPEEAYGDVRAAADAWLDWGRARGLI